MASVAISKKTKRKVQPSTQTNESTIDSSAKHTRSLFESPSSSQTDLALVAKEGWTKNPNDGQILVSKEKLSDDQAKLESSLVSLKDGTVVKEERCIYVPYLSARNCIAKMEDDMEAMRLKHIRIVDEMRKVYKEIEEESQRRFKDFVELLRTRFSDRITFQKCVIEALRKELSLQKERHELEIQSLRDKVDQLLQEKIDLLESQKVMTDEHEAEKASLVLKLAEMELLLATTKQNLETGEKLSVETKETMENQLAELSKQKDALESEVQANVQVKEAMETEIAELKQTVQTAKAEGMTEAKIMFDNAQTEKIVPVLAAVPIVIPSGDATSQDKDETSKEKDEVKEDKEDADKDAPKEEKEKEVSKTEQEDVKLEQQTGVKKSDETDVSAQRDGHNNEELYSMLESREAELMACRAVLHTSQAENEDYRDEIRALKERIKALDDQLTSEGDRANALEEKVATLTHELAAATALIEDLEKVGVGQIPEKLQADLKQYKIKLANLEKKLKEKKAVEVKSDSPAAASVHIMARITDLEKKLKESQEEKRSWKSKAITLEDKMSRPMISRSGSAMGGSVVGVAAASIKSEDHSQCINKAFYKKEKTRHEEILLALETKYKDLLAKHKELKHLEANMDSQKVEIANLKEKLARVSASASEAVEAVRKVKELEDTVKRLNKENAGLATKYTQETLLRKKYYNEIEDMKGKIRVYVRCRPMVGKEITEGYKSVIRSPDEYTIKVQTKNEEKEFQFDHIFMPSDSQTKIFEDTYHLVQSAIDGYNVCIMAYGQTGSGKTHTMIGTETGEEMGLAPRAFNRIFELLKQKKGQFKFEVTVYMVEIYMNNLIDLLQKRSKDQRKLEIKKDMKGMMYIPEVELKIVGSPEELQSIFNSGSKDRHTNATSMNDSSSRSHLVLSIIIKSTNKSTGAVDTGKLSLVDLAGSERISKTEATGEVFKEGNAINQSLSTLGQVIMSLSTNEKHIPYRESTLTMLLQDSLGGNAKTLMFINISPVDYNVSETVTSLRFAQRVKTVTNSVQKNTESKEMAKLKEENEKLRKGILGE